MNHLYAVLKDGTIVSESGEKSRNLKGAVTFLEGSWPFALSADGQLLAMTTDKGWVYNCGDYFTLQSCRNHEDHPNIFIQDKRFRNIKELYDHHALILLKTDGTVDTINIDHYWNLNKWSNIEKICPANGEDYTLRLYGIKTDGSVIVNESGYMGSSVDIKNYKGWKVVDLYGCQDSYQEGVVGLTPEGGLVGDGDYADTDFSKLIR